MIKRLSVIFILLLSILSVSYGATLYKGNSTSFDNIPNTYNNKIYSYEATILGNQNSINVLDNTIFNKPYKTFVTIQTLNNDNKTHTYKLNVVSTDSSPIFNSLNWTLQPNQQQAVGFFSSYDYERINSNVYCLDCNTSTDTSKFVVKLLDKQVDDKSIFAPLINGVVSLIEINISIWTIFYYLFVASIIIAVIVLLVYLSKRWYDFAHKHKIWGNKSNHK